MQRYVLQRLVVAVPTLLGVVAVTFGLLYVMPGDPVQLLVSSFQIESSQEQIDAIRNRFGLNDPIPVQFVRYLANVVQGNLGESILKSRPVTRLIGVHALKNALIPVVTLLGLELGRLIGGAVVVETVFARQGIGSLLIGSILDKDLPVLRGTVLVVATGYIVLNLIVDLSYGWFD